MGIFGLESLRELTILTHVTFSDSNYECVRSFANLKHLQKLSLELFLLDPSGSLHNAFGCALGETALTELRLKLRTSLARGEDLLRVVQTLLRPLCEKRRMQLVHLIFGEQRWLDGERLHACARALKSFFGYEAMSQYEEKSWDMLPLVEDEIAESREDNNDNTLSTQVVGAAPGPPLRRPIAALFEVNNLIICFGFQADPSVLARIAS